MAYSVEDLLEWVETGENGTATAGARRTAEKCRDYYDGDQLTAEERSSLEKRGQPDVVSNRIKPKIDFLLGLEKKTRTDPKAFPRNPSDDADAAESATEALRFVCDNNDFDVIRSDVFENLQIEGTGGCDVTVERKNGQMEIVLERYMWDRIIIDPHSREKNCDDAKYLGGLIWLDYDDAKARWGKVAEDIIETHDQGSSDTYDDKPDFWTDSKRKRVRVSFLYYRQDNEWYYCWFTRGGALKGPAISPYKNEHGESERSLVVQSAFVDRQGRRYGSVKQLLDTQDEVNKRKSKALHLMSVRQTFGRSDAIKDVRQLKDELARPDGHVETTYGEFGKDFGVLPTGDMAAAQFNLLQEAKGEIDAVGANAAMSGKEERSMSGRALQTRQQGGAVEIGPGFDSLKQFEKQVYRQIWYRIKQFWTEERWVRITDDEKKVRFVGFNKPMSVREQLEKELGPPPPELANSPFMDLPAQQEGKPVRENDLSTLDVDIILEDVPDTVTLEGETFEMFSGAVQSSGQQVPLEVWLELMPGFTRKKQVLALLKGDDEKAKAGQQEATEAKQLMKAEQEAKIAKTAAEAKDKEASAAERVHGMVSDMSGQQGSMI